MPRITALELPARHGDPDRAVSLLRAALSDDGPGDLVLLSECALTGYVSPQMDFDVGVFAEPLEGPTLEIYQRLAREYRTHIAGPLIELAPDDVTPQGVRGARYNTTLVVAPDGSIVAHYRKRHPWMPEMWASPGTLAYPSFQLGGCVCTLATCFDIHFLEREAVATLGATDVLLFPSAWVDEDESDGRTPIFQRLRRKFGISIVNANWGHGVPRLQGQGRSRIITEKGSLEARALPGRTWSRVDAEVGPKRAP